MAGPPAPDVLVFDVNQTLLDLTPVAAAVREALGDPSAPGEWFARMLHGSLVANHVRGYRPFGLIGSEALVTMARRRGRDLEADEALAIVERMRSLPAHPEVPEALDRLRATGLRLAALTNGSSDTVADQLAAAGIEDRFERALSVDAVERFKPAPETYLHAAAVLDSDPDRMMMVASHDWDIVGARSVGMHGAFLARPGVLWGMPDAAPEVVAPDLSVAADVILSGAAHAGR